MSERGPRHDPAAKLVRMGNQIAAFFRSYPEAEAIAGVHDHLEAFWSPRMKADLREVLARGGEGLDALVVAALRHDPKARSPTEREAAGPQEVGLLGSDAG